MYNCVCSSTCSDINVYISKSFSYHGKKILLYLLHHYFICQWVKPRKRKKSSAKISETQFLKHIYGRTVKHKLKPISSFDPRPAEYKGNASTQIVLYLENWDFNGARPFNASMVRAFRGRLHRFVSTIKK